MGWLELLYNVYVLQTATIACRHQHLVHSEHHVDRYYSPLNIRSLWYFHTLCVQTVHREKVCCFSHLHTFVFLFGTAFYLAQLCCSCGNNTQAINSI